MSAARPPRRDAVLDALDLVTGVRPDRTKARGLPGPSILPPAPDAAVPRPQWALDPNIQGFGTGPKAVRGRRPAGRVLRIYVAQKLPPDAVEVPVPPTVVVAPGQRPVRTDVVAIGRLRFEANDGRLRPALPGFSVGPPGAPSGTFGCLVRRRGDDEAVYLLSNWHVLTAYGAAGAGTPVLQPGASDGGRADDAIGALADWIRLAPGAEGFANRADAAIARVDPDRVRPFIPDIGPPAGVSTAVARGTPVQKVGRTTAYTRGAVIDPAARFLLHYPRPDGSTVPVGFHDQVLCTRFTDEGDSGSAVLNGRREVVGLHFVGSDSASVFNRIDNVLGPLGLVMVT